MNGGVPGGKIPFYVAGCVVCIGLILLTTFFQYNATYFATYKESGIRRITLAEHLRKIPLSFFGKKDLADLTSTIMADCTFLEQSFSHFIPELAGSIISTVLISIGLLFTDWRMALAALWVLPVAFAIVGFSAKIQENLNQKAMDVKMACADGKLHTVIHQPADRCAEKAGSCRILFSPGHHTLGSIHMGNGSTSRCSSQSSTACIGKKI